MYQLFKQEKALPHTSRTDMATEFAVEDGMGGVTVRHKKIPFSVTEVEVTTKLAAQTLGKPCGRYVTVEDLDFHMPMEDPVQLIYNLKPLLHRLLPSHIKTALVVGLGNRSITPDSLGPKAVQYTLVTRHLQAEDGMEDFGNTAAFAPGVLGQTGIETADMVKAVCDSIRPDVVIAVDALAAAKKHRLCHSLQFSDTGIAPGSGVKNHRHALCQSTLGVPVISIGVPTVVELADTKEGMFVTPREVDLCMEHAGKLIGALINACLHPRVALEDLLLLMG